MILSALYRSFEYFEPVGCQSLEIYYICFLVNFFRTIDVIHVLSRPKFYHICITSMLFEFILLLLNQQTCDPLAIASFLVLFSVAVTWVDCAGWSTEAGDGIAEEIRSRDCCSDTPGADQELCWHTRQTGQHSAILRTDDWTWTGINSDKWLILSLLILQLHHNCLK